MSAATASSLCMGTSTLVRGSAKPVNSMKSRGRRSANLQKRKNIVTNGIERQHDDGQPQEKFG